MCVRCVFVFVFLHFYLSLKSIKCTAEIRSETHKCSSVLSRVVRKTPMHICYIHVWVWVWMAWLLQPATIEFSISTKCAERTYISHTVISCFLFSKFFLSICICSRRCGVSNINWVQCTSSNWHVNNSVTSFACTNGFTVTAVATTSELCTTESREKVFQFRLYLQFTC